MPLPSSELRVPKHTVTVELALIGGEPRATELFLADHRPHDPRPEDVLDLLEAAEKAFLPARDAGGAFVFARDAIVWVSVPIGDAEAELYDVRHDVRVELRAGGALDGELLHSPPADRGRLVDLLNSADRFLRLFTSARVYFVHKAQVVRVVEKES